jgi:hypothetical protein
MLFILLTRFDLKLITIAYFLLALAVGVLLALTGFAGAMVLGMSFQFTGQAIPGKMHVVGLCFATLALFALAKRSLPWLIPRHRVLAIVLYSLAALGSIAASLATASFLAARFNFSL